MNINALRLCVESEITGEQKKLFERYGYRKNRREKCHRMRWKLEVYCEQKENSKVRQFNRIRTDRQMGWNQQIWETWSKTGERTEKANLWKNQTQWAEQVPAKGVYKWERTRCEVDQRVWQRQRSKVTPTSVKKNMTSLSRWSVAANSHSFDAWINHKGFLC